MEDGSLPDLVCAPHDVQDPPGDALPGDGVVKLENLGPEAGDQKGR